MLLDLLTDNATVADLVGLTFWKYIEATKDPVELVCVGTLWCTCMCDTCV